MIKKIKIIQMKDFGVEVHNCEVDIIESNTKLEFIYNEASIYFIFNICIEKSVCHLHIIEFHTEPKGKNIGKAVFAYMLEEILEVCNINYIKYFTMGGMLSTVDYNNGDWPDSLIAYQKFANRFNLEFYITDMKTEIAYINCPNELKKDKYINISDFYNPERGKVNSGYLHYSGNVFLVSKAWKKYKEDILLIQQKYENEKNKEYANYQELIQKGLGSTNKSLSVINKIKRIFHI